MARSLCLALALLTLLVACEDRPTILTLPPGERNRLAGPADLPVATTDTDSEILRLLEHRAAVRSLAQEVTPVALGRPATPAQAPEDPTVTGDVLVWRDDGQQQRTWWVTLAQGVPRIISSRAGLWLAARDDVYAWTVSRRLVKVCDQAACAAEDGACQPVMALDGPWSGRIDEVELVGIRSGNRKLVGPKLPPSVAVDLGSPGLHRYVLPIAQLDQVLIVRVVTETQSCMAMRSGTVQDDRLLTVPEGALLPLVSASDDKLLEADGKVAAALLGPGKDVARWVTAHLTLGESVAGRATWVLQHEFTRDSNGLSAGDPSGPRPSVRIAATQLPDAWRDALARAPQLEAVANELQLPAATKKTRGRMVAERDVPPDPHAGWSWLHLPPAERAVLRDLFASPKRMKIKN